MATDSENQEITLRTVLNSCSLENRRVARMWLLYTLFYWMFPTLVVIFGLLLARKSVNWLDLVIHGEFLIYAITIVAGSTRLVVKDLRNRGPFVNRQAFNLISHIMIFPAIFAYGLLRFISATSASSGGYSVSAPIVVTYSIVLLVAAFTFSYVVFLIDAQRSTPDELPRRVAAEIQHAPDRLAADFNDLQQHDTAIQAVSFGQPNSPDQPPGPVTLAAEEQTVDTTLAIQDPKPDAAQDDK